MRFHVAVTVQAENEALQKLVLEVAANKKEAKQRVAGLRDKYEDLVSQVGPGASLPASIAIRCKSLRFGNDIIRNDLVEAKSLLL